MFRREKEAGTGRRDLKDGRRTLGAGRRTLGTGKKDLGTGRRMERVIMYMVDSERSSRRTRDSWEKPIFTGGMRGLWGGRRRVMKVEHSPAMKSGPNLTEPLFTNDNKYTG